MIQKANQEKLKTQKSLWSKKETKGFLVKKIQKTIDRLQPKFRDWNTHAEEKFALLETNFENKLTRLYSEASVALPVQKDLFKKEIEASIQGFQKQLESIRKIVSEASDLPEEFSVLTETLEIQIQRLQTTANQSLKTYSEEFAQQVVTIQAQVESVRSQFVATSKSLRETIKSEWGHTQGRMDELADTTAEWFSEIEKDAKSAIKKSVDAQKAIWGNLENRELIDWKLKFKVDRFEVQIESLNSELDQKLNSLGRVFEGKAQHWDLQLKEHHRITEESARSIPNILKAGFEDMADFLTFAEKSLKKYASSKNEKILQQLKERLNSHELPSALIEKNLYVLNDTLRSRVQEWNVQLNESICWVEEELRAQVDHFRLNLEKWSSALDPAAIEAETESAVRKTSKAAKSSKKVTKSKRVKRIPEVKSIEKPSPRIEEEIKKKIEDLQNQWGLMDESMKGTVQSFQSNFFTQMEELKRQVDEASVKSNHAVGRTDDFWQKFGMLEKNLGDFHQSLKDSVLALESQMENRIRGFSQKMGDLQAHSETLRPWAQEVIQNKVESLREQWSFWNSDLRQWVEARQGDLKVQIEELKTQVSEKNSAFDEKISKLDNRLTRSIASVQKVRDLQDDDLNARLESLQKKAEDFYLKLEKEHLGQVQGIQKQVDSLQGQMQTSSKSASDQLQSQIDLLWKRLLEFEEVNQGADTELKDELTSELNELQEKVESLSEGLEANMDSLAQDLAPRMQKIEETYNNIRDEIQTEIGPLQNNLLEFQKGGILSEEKIAESIVRVQSAFDAKEKEIMECVQSMDEHIQKTVLRLEGAYRSKVHTIEVKMQEFQELLNGNTSQLDEKVRLRTDPLEEKIERIQEARIHQESKMQETLASLEKALAEKESVLAKRIQDLGNHAAETFADFQREKKEQAQILKTKIEAYGIQLDQKAVQIEKEVQVEIKKEVSPLSSKLYEIEKENKETNEKMSESLATLKDLVNAGELSVEARIGQLDERAREAIAKFENEQGQQAKEFKKEIEEFRELIQSNASLLSGKIEVQAVHLRERYQKLREESQGESLKVKEELYQALSKDAEALRGELFSSQKKFTSVWEPQLKGLENELRRWREVTGETIVTLDEQIKSLGGTFAEDFAKATKKLTDQLNSWKEQAFEKNIRLQEEVRISDQENDKKIKGLEKSLDQRLEKEAGARNDIFSDMKEQLDFRVEEFSSQISDITGRLEGRASQFERLFQAQSSGFMERFEDFQKKMNEGIEDAKKYAEKRSQSVEDLLEQVANERKEALDESQKTLERKDEELTDRIETLHKIIGKVSQEFDQKRAASNEKLEKSFREEFGNLSQKLSSLEHEMKGLSGEIEKSIFDKAFMQIQETFEDFQKKSKEMIRKTERNALRRIHFKLGSSLIFYAGLALAGVIAIFAFVSSRTDDLMENAISKKMALPEWTQTIVQTTREEVPGILEDKANAVITDMRGEASKRIQDFEAYLQSAKERHSKTTETWARQVAQLEGINKIADLESKTIQASSRPSYEALLQLKTKVRKPEFQRAINASLSRIQTFYKDPIRAKESLDFRTAKKLKELTQGQGSDSANDLIAIMNTDPDWRIRAKAAEKLRSWRGVRIPDALLKTAETDESLDVVRKALISFEMMTGYKSKDLFDVEAAQAWWAQNREKEKPFLEL